MSGLRFHYGPENGRRDDRRRRLAGNDTIFSVAWYDLLFYVDIQHLIGQKLGMAHPFFAHVVFDPPVNENDHQDGRGGA